MSIRVYCKENCMQCLFVKKELDNNKIEYKEFYIDKDPKALQEVKEMGFQGVPVIVADGHEAFHGFNPDKLAEIIEDET